MPREEVLVDTSNEYMLGYSQAYGVISEYSIRCTTKQATFRLAAWLISLGELLPDEPGDHTFVQVLEAIRNT
jgi:hypothetical protein